MRNVFFALLFVNLLYFGWSHLVATPRPPPVNETIARLPRLKLASERPAPQPAKPAANTAEKTVPAPQPAPNTAEKTALNESPGCMSVGPFGDVENSIRTAALLRERGFDPRQRAEAGGTLREYWVYVGGVKSDDEANRVLRNLQRLGFKDAQVMPDGGDPGRRVSLGLFNDRGGADQRMWAARLKGFQADVAERNPPATVYWVDVMPLAAMGTVPIQNLLAERLSSRIAVQPCPAAARPKSTSAADLITPARQPATVAIPKLP